MGVCVCDPAEQTQTNTKNNCTSLLWVYDFGFKDRTRSLNRPLGRLSPSLQLFLASKACKQRTRLL